MVVRGAILAATLAGCPKSDTEGATQVSAGPDQVVREGTMAWLEGEAPEGSAVRWSQIGGPLVQLVGARSLRVGFEAPQVAWHVESDELTAVIDPRADGAFPWLTTFHSADRSVLGYLAGDRMDPSMAVVGTDG